MHYDYARFMMNTIMHDDRADNKWMSSALHFEHTNDAGRPLQQCQIGRPHENMDAVTNNRARFGMWRRKRGIHIGEQVDMYFEELYKTLIDRMSLEPVMGNCCGSQTGSRIGIDMFCDL